MTKTFDRFDQIILEEIMRDAKVYVKGYSCKTVY